MGAILQQTAVVQGTGAMLTKIAVLLEENAFLRWTAEGDVDENRDFIIFYSSKTGRTWIISCRLENIMVKFANWERCNRNLVEI